MLYLLYFLLRDGAALSKTVREALPMARPHTHYLLNKFTTVIRATIKGNVAVAAVQGALGGLAFWVLGVQGALLWAVLMAFLSLLPAVGAALVWLPVAIYFLAIGDVWQGVLADRLRRGGDRAGRQHPAPDPGRQGHADARLHRADVHRRRHGAVRHQRLRDRAGDRGAVHGRLGPVRLVERRGRGAEA